jgi:Histidine kinase-, DNA gyrase B-, and HSP90-like ATPase
MSKAKRRLLRLKFHGRIIDHLGIQMYQSPVAAIAELVSNSWDADAKSVRIVFPKNLSNSATIEIADDGDGMTFDECENRYLNVGYCRRGIGSEERSPGGRPILGRKGIGKFAGFGIAEIVVIDTTSKKTGERTVFELDVNRVRSDEYVSEGGEVAVTSYDPPNSKRREKHGTTITLKTLTLGRAPSSAQFLRSLARRFLLLKWAEGFTVSVDGTELSESQGVSGVEFSFPRDYRPEEIPSCISMDGDWGVESLGGDREIRWRFHFFEEPIEDEELRGVSIFAKVKLAQKPFLFNLAGGLGGQHGQEYLSGQVQADYVDALPKDIISPERQRINWEHKDAIPLEDWGQKRVKQLLRIWKERRGEKRRQEVEDRVAGFSTRLNRLNKREAKIVRGALSKLGGIPALSKRQFEELADGVLTAWEQGRLKDLIGDLSQEENISSDSLLKLLAEVDVLSALNVAEAVRTKLEAIRGLRRLVRKQELENEVRDYIAERPYLLDPKWETFKKETSVQRILDDAAGESRLIELDDSVKRKRIDLALRSGTQLLVVEFMRPGLPADWDHISRCRRYLNLIKEKVAANSSLGISEHQVTGLIVADDLEKKPDIRREVRDMAQVGIIACEWGTLLDESEKRWTEFLKILKERAPDDPRLAAL